MNTEQLKQALLSRKPKPLQWSDGNHAGFYAEGVNSYFEIRHRLTPGGEVRHSLWINNDPYMEVESSKLHELRSFCELKNSDDFRNMIDDLLDYTEEKH